MSADRLLTPVKVNRILLLLMTTIACFVGVAPAVFALGRPIWLLYFLIGAELMASSLIFQIKGHATEAPRPIDYLSAFLAGIWLAALVGCSWLIIYGFVYIGTRAIVFLLYWISISVSPNADSIAFWSSAIFACVMGLAMAADAVQNMATQLYPKAAGLQPAFQALTRSRQQQMLSNAAIGLFIGIAFVTAYWFLPPAWAVWPFVFFEYALILSLEPFHELGQRQTVTAARAVSAIGRLFHEQGYQITFRPRTGNPRFDPLLEDVDLIAWREDRAIAVSIKVGDRQGRTPVSWTAATNLSAAAFALLQATETLELVVPPGAKRPHDVRPMLVLVGIQPDKGLAAYAEKEQYPLATLSEVGFVARAMNDEMTHETVIRAKEELTKALDMGNRIASPSSPSSTEVVS